MPGVAKLDIFVKNVQIWSLSGYTKLGKLGKQGYTFGLEDIQNVQTLKTLKIQMARYKTQNREKKPWVAKLCRPGDVS